MKVYIYVKNDKYQLPIAIADTRAELSRVMKKPTRWAKERLMAQRKNINTKHRYLVLELDI